MNDNLLDLIKQEEGGSVVKTDYRALSIRLYKALKRLMAHECVGRWTQAPFPHSQRLGCQFCEREWISHAPDCLYLRLEKFTLELDSLFKNEILR